MRSCIVSGLPVHLVQELIVDTVSMVEKVTINEITGHIIL